MSTTTQGKTHVSWVIDEQGVERARKRLRLKKPVEVRLLSANDWQWGWYSPGHTVWANPTIPSCEEVSSTLWHELGHALQCERYFDGDGERYVHETNARFYIPFFNKYSSLRDEDYNQWYDLYFDKIPLEREAEEIAQWYAQYIPLVQPTS